jgi:hypothetical protein
MLLALGYSKPPLFIGVPWLLCRNWYLWHVCVIIYERPMTDHIRRIRHVVEATKPRWTFEGGKREATLTWMSGFPKMGVMIEIGSSSLSL